MDKALLLTLRRVIETFEELTVDESDRIRRKARSQSAHSQHGARRDDESDEESQEERVMKDPKKGASMDPKKGANMDPKKGTKNGSKERSDDGSEEENDEQFEEGTEDGSEQDSEEDGTEEDESGAARPRRKWKKGDCITMSKTLVCQVVGSGHQKGSRRQYWIKHTGIEWPEECQMEHCANPAKVGAHIYRKGQGPKQTFILAACQACNKSADNHYDGNKTQWRETKVGAIAAWIKRHEGTYE